MDADMEYRLIPAGNYRVKIVSVNAANSVRLEITEGYHKGRVLFAPMHTLLPHGLRVKVTEEEITSRRVYNTVTGPKE
jgi:hypothetical protein